MSVFNRLHETYVGLNQSALVKGTINEETMEEFKNLLNTAMPTNSEEWAQYNVIRRLMNISRENNDSFVNYLNHPSNRSRSFILWTDGTAIAYHFNLMHKVYLGWDAESKLYDVRVFEGRKRAQEAQPVEKKSKEFYDNWTTQKYKKKTNNLTHSESKLNAIRKQSNVRPTYRDAYGKKHEKVQTKVDSVEAIVEEPTKVETTPVEESKEIKETKVDKVDA